MRSITAVAAGACALALPLSAPTAHAVLVYADPADAHIGYSASGIPVFQTTNTQNTLGNNGGFVYATVTPFALPPRPAGQTVAAATFSFRILRNGINMGYEGDVYGLPARTSPAVQLADYFVGPLDPAATLVGNDAVRADNTDINNYVVITVAGPALAAYLNAAYAQVGDGGFAFLRLNPDATPTGTFPSYFIPAAEYNFPGPDQDRRPTLDITFIPAPSAAALLTLGAPLATRRRR